MVSLGLEKLKLKETRYYTYKNQILKILVEWKPSLQRTPEVQIHLSDLQNQGQIMKPVMDDKEEKSSKQSSHVHSW